MGIDSLAKISDIDLSNRITESGVNKSNGTAFEELLNSAMNMIEETNSLQKAAQQAEINYELGYSDNTNELGIAQKKANVALQYTVAVRDKIVDAYKELMQMTV